MTSPGFSPGFRFSLSDATVLLAGVCGSIFFGMKVWYAGFIIAFTVAHFFLFCNVFRIERKPELLWGGLFTTLVIATVKFDFPGWPATIALSSGMTIFLLHREMKKPGYHGIGWQKINPQLQSWWQEKYKQQ